MSWNESVGTVRGSVSLMRLERLEQWGAKQRLEPARLRCRAALALCGSRGAAARWSFNSAEAVFKGVLAVCVQVTVGLGGRSRRCLHGGRRCRVPMCGCVGGGTPGLGADVPGPAHTPALVTPRVTALPAPVLIVLPSLSSLVSGGA